MASGGTRKLARVGEDGGFDAFREGREALLVVASGPAAGSELRLESPRVLVGRGAAMDLRLDDDATSQEHAAFEFAGGGFRVCDLGSTNGTRVNGAEVQVADLEHGDRIEIGQHVLQLVVQERRREPRVHVLPES